MTLLPNPHSSNQKSLLSRVINFHNTSQLFHISPPPSLISQTPNSGSFISKISSRFHQFRQKLRPYVSSPYFHRTILLLIILDVLIVLSVLLLNLFICELSPKTPSSPPNSPGSPPLPGNNDTGIVRRMKIALNVLEESSFVLSCVFMLELSLTILGFGWRYLLVWIHLLDGFIITAGFVVDLVLKGPVEEVAGLVVVLRLWRLVKIAEEIVVEAYQETEDSIDHLKEKIEELEKENEGLRMSERERSSPV